MIPASFAQMPGEMFDKETTATETTKEIIRARLLHPQYEKSDLVEESSPAQTDPQIEALQREDGAEHFLNDSKIVQLSIAYFHKFERAFQKNFWRVARNLLCLKSFKISGISKLSEAELSNYTGLKRGNWLWNYSFKDITKSLKQHPWVQSSDINLKFFPLHLYLKVVEKQPWITAEISEGVWVVDTSGELITPLSSVKDMNLLDRLSSLPALRGLRGNAFQSDNAKFSVATQSLKNIEASGFSELGFNVAVADLKPDGSLILTPVNQKLFPNIRLMAGDFDKVLESVRTFKLISRDLKTRDEKTNLIDLRFSGRAIVR